MSQNPIPPHWEEVEGISRFHERLFIERDGDGHIAQVYDGGGQPVEIVTLYRSFLIRSELDGFFYKKEWVPYPGFAEIAKKRALGLQRGTYRTRDPSEIL